MWVSSFSPPTYRFRFPASFGGYATIDDSPWFRYRLEEPSCLVASEDASSVLLRVGSSGLHMRVAGKYFLQVGVLHFTLKPKSFYPMSMHHNWLI